MGIYFTNSTPYTVYMARMIQDNSCSNGWAKRGWQIVTPGRTALIISGNTAGITFYWYAEDNYGNVWRGPFDRWVPRHAFYLCSIDRCSTCTRQVGFIQELANNTYNTYYELVHSSSQRKYRSRKIRIARKQLNFRKYPHGVETNRKMRLK